MLTIESLMEDWARWCARRDDGGLGYRTSGLNRLMAGGELRFGGQVRSIPYGVDVDSVCSDIDVAVARLPLRRREVVHAEYRRIGLQKDKAIGLGITDRMYRKHLNFALVQISLHPAVNRLLKSA